MVIKMTKTQKVTKPVNVVVVEATEIELKRGMKVHTNKQYPTVYRTQAPFSGIIDSINGENVTVLRDVKKRRAARKTDNQTNHAVNLRPSEITIARKFLVVIL